MSRKALVLATAWVTAGAMYRVYPNDREDDVDNLVALSVHYAPLALAMVDTGWDMAMQFPDNVERGCYEDFGEWLFSHINENGGDAPTHEEVVEFLVENTLTEYDGIVSETQKELLETKCKALGAEFPPYQ